MNPSPIQARAERFWPAKVDAPEWAAVRASWAQRQGDTPFPANFEAWQAVMRTETDGDLTLIACLRDAAPLAREAGQTNLPKAAETIVALMLHAFEHYVRRHVGSDIGADALAARLRHIDEPLAAQVVAACLTGQGLLLMASASGGEPEAEAANVIGGLSPEVLHQRDGKDAVRLEVDAALSALRPSAGAGSLKQRRAAARAKQQTPRSEAAIRVDVAAFYRQWHAHLMFVVPDADAAAALKEPLVCDYAAQQLGVGVFRHGGAEQAADAAWLAVVADVVAPLREAIGQLFPKAPIEAAAVAHGAPPQVFLSYAHADAGSTEVSAVLDCLQALAKHGHIRLWQDTQNLRSGQDFHPDIQAGIDSSQLALVLLSTRLINSTYVTQHELPHILRRRDAGQLVLCPFMLSKCDHPVLPELAHVNFKFGVQSLEDMGASGRSKHLTRLSQWLREPTGWRGQAA